MTRYADLFQSAEIPTAAATPGGEPVGEATEQFTLLFVDDEESVLHALRRIFLEENYEIRTADSGFSAVRLLDQPDEARSYYQRALEVCVRVRFRPETCRALAR